MPEGQPSWGSSRSACFAFGVSSLRSAQDRFLSDLENWSGQRVPHVDARSLTGFLESKLASGAHPNTVRKYVGIVRAFYRREYEAGRVSAEMLLDVLSVKPPREATRRAQPQPYRRNELSRLWATLEERWPRLPHDEAWFWLRRWVDGRSPYSRVRPHAIRSQLDAVIGLALYCGLRRREIFQLDEEAMHDDNAYVVIFDEPRNWSAVRRTVPYTDATRELIAPWCRMRGVIAPEHSRAWLNLYAETTAHEPMSRDTFNKLLRTYLGPGWTLARLRATCGVAWAKAGLAPEHLRHVLGYASISDVHPYLALVGGDVERQMYRHEGAFVEQLATSR